jgi:putative nucleotidyltransferase with HDIG domain
LRTPPCTSALRDNCPVPEVPFWAPVLHAGRHPGPQAVRARPRVDHLPGPHGPAGRRAGSVPVMVDVLQAEVVARRLLSGELPRRWRHSAGVAAQASRLALRPGMDLGLVVAAAWLHDIGYASRLVDTGFHPLDGARHLRGLALDERVVNLVAHHSCARIEARLRGLEELLRHEFPRDPLLPHDELCFCDQTTSPDGELVDVAERLAEIRGRYEEGHVVRLFVDLAEAELVATVRRVEARYDLQPR